MIFSRHKEDLPLPQAANQSNKLQVAAAVSVYNTFWAFSDDTAVYRWTAEILAQNRPDMTLAPNAITEAIVGHRLGKNDTRVNMVELLGLMLTRAGLSPPAYRLEFFEFDLGLSRRVWCVTAVPHP